MGDWRRVFNQAARQSFDPRYHGPNTAFSGITRTIRGVAAQVDRTVTGAKHIASGEFRPGPDGGHHVHDGAPAGMGETHDRYRRESRQDRQRQPEGDPRRYHHGGEAGNNAQPEVQASAGANPNINSVMNLRPETMQALNRIQALPEDQRISAFNNLQLDQKQEIVQGLNRVGSLIPGTAPLNLSLDTNGNLDVAAMARFAQQNVTTMSRPAEHSNAAVSAVERTIEDIVGDVARSPEAARERETHNAPAGTTVTPAPAAAAFQMPSSGTQMTTALANQLSAQGILPLTVGQGAEATTVYMKEGRIVGGYDRTASDRDGGRFIDRDALETKLAGSGKTVAQLETIAGAATQVATQTPAPAVETPAPAAPAVETPRNVFTTPIQWA